MLQAMSWALDQIGVTVRGLAFFALALGPVGYLLHRWDVAERNAILREASDGQPARPKTARRTAIRWLQALGLVTVCWLVAASAFPGPWSR